MKYPYWLSKSTLWKYLFLKVSLFFLFIVFFPLPCSPFIPPPHSNHHSVVYVHEYLFLFAQFLHPLPSPCPSCHLALCRWVCPHFPCSFSLFIRFNIWAKSYGICLSLTGVFHLAECSPGPSTQSQRVKFSSSFLWLNSIPLCKCPIVVLSTYLLIDTWAASTSWRLHITLQWT